MNITIKKYGESNVDEMIRIWNEVVDEGIAFPQEDFLDSQSGRKFFAGQTAIPERFTVFTFFTRIMSEDADTLPMQAMLLPQMQEDFTSVKNSSGIP